MKTVTFFAGNWQKQANNPLKLSQSENYIKCRVGSFGHFIFANYLMKSRIRELFGRFSIQICTFYQPDCIISCGKYENGRLKHSCWNMHDHVMYRKGWEAAGIAWK